MTSQKRRHKYDPPSGNRNRKTGKISDSTNDQSHGNGNDGHSATAVIKYQTVASGVQEIAVPCQNVEYVAHEIDCHGGPMDPYGTHDFHVRAGEFGPAKGVTGLFYVNGDGERSIRIEGKQRIQGFIYNANIC